MTASKPEVESGKGISSTIAREYYRRARTGAAYLVGYVPPVLHEGKKGWYVDYYVRNPNSGILKRQRLRVNRVKDIKARRLWARQVMLELTAKLQSGWNPWMIQDPDAFMSCGQALDRWDSAKDKQLRHSSGYSYISMTKILRDWMRTENLLDRPIAEISRVHLGRFLRYLTEERHVSNRTYNNYLVYVGMVFRWLVENSFIGSSPVTNFQKFKTERKTRTYLSEEERSQMVSWIKRNDPEFLLPCLFIYGTLIRPGELRRLRVQQVDFKRQVVTLPAEETKSGIERTPAIPDWMLKILLEQNVNNYPLKCWLIGSRLTPSTERAARNTLNAHWVKMRIALGWDNRRQLYSLRDTGIIQLLRDGVDLLHVMQQAGHTEVSTTNKYLRHAFPNGPAEVKSKATSLSSTRPLAQAEL